MNKVIVKENTIDMEVHKTFTKLLALTLDEC